MLGSIQISCCYGNPKYQRYWGILQNGRLLKHICFRIFASCSDILCTQLQFNLFYHLMSNTNQCQ